MICVSKADESSPRHLAWNQNPAPLANANTTCQDLNGMANLREHVAAGQDDGGAGGAGNGGGLSGSPGGKGGIQDHQHGRLKGSADGAGRLSCFQGLSSCPMAADGGDRIRPSRGAFLPCASHIWTYLSGVLSGYVAIVILSSLGVALPLPAIPSCSVLAPSVSTGQDRPVSNPAPVLLQRDTCADGGVNPEEYDLPLHVAALFIILVVSSLACAFPILAVRFPGLRVPSHFFFGVRHFGTGVLIATALVHLVPTAFISLGNPCLGSFWTEDYPAIPGAIALAAILLVTVIEMIFHPYRHAIRTARPCSQVVAGENSAVDPNDEDGNSVAQQPQQETDKASVGVAPVLQLTEAQQHHRELLQCVMLELGILFHSIFIGMALSVSIGNDFIILLIAIIFHQTFEGLALGSRIAAVKWPNSKLQPWLMALAYGCTTPLGQGIGLATHTLYSPDSKTGLIMVGVMNAISAGLLTFASLVELLSEDFLSDRSWTLLQGSKRVFACILVFLGAAFMSLVGAWA